MQNYNFGSLPEFDLWKIPDGGLGSGFSVLGEPVEVSTASQDPVEDKKASKSLSVAKQEQSYGKVVKRRKKPRLQEGMTSYIDEQGRMSIVPCGYIPVPVSDLIRMNIKI